MRKILIIVSLMIFCGEVYTQKEDYALFRPDDYLIIDNIKEKYVRSNYKLLVYQTGYNNECISSILLIHTENQIRYWCILFEKEKDTTFLKVIEGGCIENDSIFTYVEYKQAGITEKEELSENLDFITPSRESEKIYYEDNHISFYFEDNTDTSPGYVVNKNREKYRQQWTKIIRRGLMPVFERYCK